MAPLNTAIPGEYVKIHLIARTNSEYQPVGWYKYSLSSEEAGKAQFNLATATYATVAYSAMWFINKTHLKLLQEGFNVEPQRIFG